MPNVYVNLAWLMCKHMLRHVFNCNWCYSNLWLMLHYLQQVSPSLLKIRLLIKFLYIVMLIVGRLTFRLGIPQLHYYACRSSSEESKYTFPALALWELQRKCCTVVHEDWELLYLYLLHVLVKTFSPHRCSVKIEVWPQGHREYRAFDWGSCLSHLVFSCFSKSFELGRT